VPTLQALSKSIWTVDQACNPFSSEKIIFRKTETTQIQVSSHLENQSFDKAKFVPVEKKVKTAKEHFKTIA